MSEHASETHGLVVVKRFEVLYAQFAAKPKLSVPVYAIPVHGTTPETARIRYRGLDREGLNSWRGKNALLAQIRLAELEDAARYADEMILSVDSACDVLGWAEEESPGMYEVVWARVAGSVHEPPAGFERLGYEPSYFTSDHFSAICDCMCFPRWHGTDYPEGVLFKSFFEQLNPNGLFDSADLAREFLSYYLSFDWTETGDYEIAEVWAPAGPLNAAPG